MNDFMALALLGWGQMRHVYSLKTLKIIANLLKRKAFEALVSEGRRLLEVRHLGCHLNRRHDALLFPSSVTTLYHFSLWKFSQILTPWIFEHFHVESEGFG
jgi:hypothetical protein